MATAQRVERAEGPAEDGVDAGAAETHHLGQVVSPPSFAAEPQAGSAQQHPPQRPCVRIHPLFIPGPARRIGSYQGVVC